MNILVNGQQLEVTGELSLAQFVEQKQFNPDNIVIEYNHDIVGKDQWVNIILKANDTLEIVSFVGGG